MYNTSIMSKKENIKLQSLIRQTIFNAISEHVNSNIGQLSQKWLPAQQDIAKGVIADLENLKEETNAFFEAQKALISAYCANSNL